MMAKFNSKTERTTMFQNWLYNGKNCQKLEMLYQRIVLFKKACRLNLS